MDIYGLSRLGLVRTVNQDRFVFVRKSGGLLMAVADGLGGHAGGEIAATIMVKSLRSFSPNGDGGSGLMAQVKLAHEQISALKEQDDKLEGMGTTVTAVHAVGDTATYIHSGDSRLYLMRDGELSQVTRDHSFFQELLDSGDVTLEEVAVSKLRNVLDQCVGCPGLKPDIGQLSLCPKDILLVCTDGLHRYVSEERMADFLSSSPHLREALERMTGEALEAGGRDNITVAACKV